MTVNNRKNLLEKLLTLDVVIRSTILKYILNINKVEFECILFPINNRLEEIRQSIINMDEEKVDKPKRNFEILFVNHETVLIKIFKFNQIDKYFHANIDLIFNKEHLIHMCKEHLYCSKEEFNQALQEFKNK